jgi:uncharacterized protein
MLALPDCSSRKLPEQHPAPKDDLMLHAQTVPVFLQQGQALLGQLDKAQAWITEQGLSDADLLETRLTPDMFPLAKQLDFVVAQMLQPLRRLTGTPLPDPAEAAPTLASHRDRLKAALDMLAPLSPDNFAAPDTMVAMDLPNGMVFDLSAADYVRDWAMPQFWFHIMTSYALLRMRGVPIGKADFVPHMLRYLRKG